MHKNISQRYLVIAEQLLFSGSNFMLTFFLARHLGSSLFGAYSTYIIALFLFMSLSQALIIQPMQIFLGKLNTGFRYANFIDRLAGKWLMLFVSFGLLLLPLGIEFGGFLMYSGAFIAFDMLRKKSIATAQLRQIIKQVFIMVIGLALTVLLIWNFEIKSIGLLFLLLGTPYLFLPLRLLIKSQKVRREYNLLFIRKHWKEGKWFLMAAISQWFSNNVFLIAAGAYLSLQALGALRFVQSLFGLLNVLLQGVENFVIPQMAKVVSSSKLEFYHKLSKFSKKSIPLMIVFIIPIFLWAQDLLVFAGGASYEGYALLFRGFCMLYMLIFVLYPVRIAIRSLLLNRTFFVAYLFASIFAVLSMQLLFEHFGINAAVIGFVINQLILAAIWFRQLIKENYLPWKLYI